MEYISCTVQYSLLLIEFCCVCSQCWNLHLFPCQQN